MVNGIDPVALFTKHDKIRIKQGMATGPIPLTGGHTLCFVCQPMWSVYYSVCNSVILLLLHGLAENLWIHTSLNECPPAVLVIGCGKPGRGFE